MYSLAVLLAAPPPVPPVDPVTLFDTTWLPILMGFVSVVTLVFVVIYVIKTVQIAQGTLASVQVSERAVQEMRAARDEQTAPYVVVYFDASDFVVRLVMENVGQTAARDVSLHFEPELDVALRPGGAAGVGWPAFVTGTTPNLAPKQRLSALVGGSVALFSNPALKGPYAVTVTYSGGMSTEAQDALRQATYILDLKSFLGILLPGETPIEKAADKLDGLTKKVGETNDTLETIAERLNTGLRVTSAQLPLVDEQHEVRSLATGICLLEGLRVSWTLLEEKNRAREHVPEFDRNLIRHNVEQIAELVPHMGLTGEVSERVQRLSLELRGLIRNHFRYGMDVETKVTAALDELLTVLRAQRPEPDEPEHGDSAEAVGATTSAVPRTAEAESTSEHAHPDRIQVHTSLGRRRHKPARDTSPEREESSER